MSAVLNKTKLMAVMTRLALSLLVITGSFLLLSQYWYPGLLFQLAGGWQGLKIITMADLVLGPLLTLVIFNPGKGRGKLLFDLIVLTLLQLAALGWTLQAAYSLRPVALSYHAGQFHAVLREDFDEQEASADEVRQFGSLPALVYTRKPANSGEATGMATFSFMLGLGPEKLFYLWTPLHEHLDQIEYADKDTLSRNHPQKAAAISAAADTAVLFEGRYGLGLIILDERGSWQDSLILERY